MFIPLEKLIINNFQNARIIGRFFYRLNLLIYNNEHIRRILHILQISKVYLRKHYGIKLNYLVVVKICI